MIDLTKYKPDQLMERLTPKKAAKDFGLSLNTLQYWRDCTKDTGTLHGPAFFKYENVIFYQVKVLIDFINSNTHESQETPKRPETLKVVQTK